MKVFWIIEIFLGLSLGEIFAQNPQVPFFETTIHLLQKAQTNPQGLASQKAQDAPPLGLSLKDQQQPSDQFAQAMVGDEIQIEIKGVPPSDDLKISVIPELKSQTDSMDSSKDSSKEPVDVPTFESALKEKGWHLRSQTNTPSIILTLVPIKPGALTFPGLELLDSEKVIGLTQSIDLKIESAISPSDPSPLQPEAPLGPLSLGFPWYVLILLGLLALIILFSSFFGVYCLIQRLRKKKQLASQSPPLPAHVIALKLLDELCAQGFEDPTLFKKMAFAASEILKGYLKARYSFNALESTTREILYFMHQHGILSVGEALNQLLEQISDEMDVVKFTDLCPTSEQFKATLKGVKQWIEQDALRRSF